MSWCFAIINGRLAEIYFNETKKGPKFLGHCYVEKSEYTTKNGLRQTQQNLNFPTEIKYIKD